MSRRRWEDRERAYVRRVRDAAGWCGEDTWDFHRNAMIADVYRKCLGLSMKEADTAILEHRDQKPREKWVK